MPYVDFFPHGGGGRRKGSVSQLGNKGAHLAEMSRMGLPVPPGFTISTSAFRFLHRKGRLPPSLRPEVEAGLEALGRTLGFRFGDPERPLLVSVRSSPPVSMPGMMSTISNVGLTRATLDGLVRSTNDPEFVYDTFRRLIETYARAVAGQPDAEGGRDVSTALAEHRRKTAGGGRAAEEEPSAERPAQLCDEYLQIFEDVARRRFPDSAGEQLWEAVLAVFNSWYARPAVAYRERAGIPDETGTAVTVQAMVFGNLVGSSGAGVLFTRDPVAGRPAPCGEWLPNAQGEDVVDGLLTPYCLSADACPRETDRPFTLEEAMPGAFSQLLEVARILEAHYRRVQEVEFIVQEGRLWVLQTRDAELSGRAALRTAVDMAREGMISAKEAVRRTEAIPLDDVLWSLEPGGGTAPFARGTPASSGLASGAVALTADRAERYAQRGRRAILVSDYVEPEDIHGIDAADGLVTNRGGMASHLAVTARGWGKACVVGCGTLSIDARRRTLLAGGHSLKEGDEVTVDGAGGLVYRGRLARRRGDAESDEYVRTVSDWRRRHGSPEDTRTGG